MSSKKSKIRRVARYMKIAKLMESGQIFIELDQRKNDIQPNWQILSLNNFRFKTKTLTLNELKEKYPCLTYGLDLASEQDISVVTLIKAKQVSELL